MISRMWMTPKPIDLWIIDSSRADAITPRVVEVVYNQPISVTSDATSGTTASNMNDGK